MIYFAQISKLTVHYERQRRCHGGSISNSTSPLQQLHTHKTIVRGFPKETKVTLPKPDTPLSAVCHLGSKDRPSSNFPSATKEAFLTTVLKGRQEAITPTQTSSHFAISILPVKNLHLWGSYKGWQSKSKWTQPQHYSPLTCSWRPVQQGKQGTEASCWVTQYPDTLANTIL